MYEIDGIQYSEADIIKLAELKGVSFEEILQNPKVKQVKTSGVETGATTPMETAPDMDSNLEDGFLEPQENKIKITPIESIKNAFSNSIKDTKRIFEFWGGESGTAELATAAIWEEVLGRDRTESLRKKYGDSWVAQGIGVEEILGNIEEAKQELSKKETLGLVESFKDGDAGDIAGAVISSVVNALGSVGYFLGTAGTGYFFDYAAENYIDYNEAKAKRNNKNLEDIIIANEDETLAPVSIAFAQSALEKYGLSKLLKGFGSKIPGVGGKIIDVLKVGGQEASTEIGQHVLGKYNQRLAEDGQPSNAIKKVFDEDIFTVETLESGLQGFVGSAGLRTTGTIAGSIPSKKVKIDPLLYTAARTSEESKEIENGFNDLVSATKLFNNTKNQEVKDIAEQKITEARSKINDAVVSGRERVEKLTLNEQRRLKGYANETIKKAKQIQEAKQLYETGVLQKEEFETLVEDASQAYKQNLDNISKTIQIIDKIERQAEVASEFTNVEVIETQAEFNERFPESATREIKPGVFSIVDAAIDQEGTIFINKQGATKLKVITSASHELAHKILRNTFAFKLDEKGEYLNKEKALNLVNEFESIIDKYDKKGVVRERLNSFYNVERDENGKIVDGNIEEYLTVFSDTLIDGDIEVEQTLLQRLKEFVLNALRDVGFINADFKSADDVYSFLIDYSKTFTEQDKVSKRAQNILSAEEIKEAKVFRSERQQKLNDRIDDLVGERDEDGKYKLTKQEYDTGAVSDVYLSVIEGNMLDPLIMSKVDTRYLYGKNQETFLQDVKDELVSTIMNFDPEKNDSLIGWINSQMSWKKQAVFKRYKKESGEAGTLSIDVEQGEVGAIRELATEEEFDEAIDVFGTEQERVDALIRPADIIGDADLIQEEVRGKMDLLNMEDISFKAIPNLVPEFVSVYTGIPVNKIVDPKVNLSTAQMVEAQKAIYADRKKLMKLLPKGAVVEAARQELIGTSTGVKKNLLREFYEMDPQRRTEAPGLWEFKLKPNITEEQFLAAFGIELNGDRKRGVGPRDTQGQTIKAFSDMLGKMVTNSEVRKILAERGVDARTIQDIAAGKSEAMFSRRQDVESKLERREAMSLEQMEQKMSAMLSAKDKRYTPAERIDKATAKNMALDKKRRFNLIPSTADDFVGLLYRFLSKGKLGEEQMEFFKETLLKPFGRAYNTLNVARQTISKDYKSLEKNNPEVKKKLKQNTGYKGFTFEDALRVHLYTKSGFTPKGLDQETITQLNKLILKNKDLFNYGVELSSMLRQDTYWVEPDGNNWQVDNIKSDVNRTIEQVSRKKFLKEWIENKEVIFSENNMNKITATYGEDFVRSLRDMLYRMESGLSNPERGLTPELNGLLNWFRGSVGVTMFLNTRSAVLQTISFANFVNWGDNNMFKASQAFANQTQFWSDFAKLFNSDYLKERRGGLKTDVNAADIADALRKTQGMYNGYKAAIAKLLEKGFVLTQIGDSFAISFGGAMFYRNRINTYLSQGFSEQEATEKAFLDFQEISEETQQSARPDKLSLQQTSELGRIFLAFQNTPMQYARLTVKATKDLANGRGDVKENISKIAYYSLIQSVIFASLQQAFNLFSLGEDDEDEEKAEEKQRKVETVANNVLDSFVRGIGLRGAYLVTAKNALSTYLKQEAKQEEGGGRADHAYTLVAISQVSPPVGIKARNLYSTIQQYRYNKDVIKELGLNIENPAYDITGSMSSVVFNVPLDRMLYKARNVKDALDEETEMWKSVMLLMGWNRWNLGIENKDLEKVKADLKKQRALQRKRKSKKKPSKKFTL
jgi:hypothetical protein